MKAVTYHTYGGPEVLTLDEIPMPVPKDNEVLVRIRAASLNPYDRYLMRGRPYVARVRFGMFKPNVNTLGQDFAGEVVSVGKQVTKFNVGDKVFGDVDQVFSNVTRALSQYTCVGAEKLALIPSNISFEEAAAIPMAGRTALQGLVNMGQLKQGQSVLINGASSGIGTFAVQIAKAYGANVTAICGHRNITMVSGLGADRVIDYVESDFTELSDRFDLILDIICNKPMKSVINLLRQGGIYVFIGTPDPGPWLGPISAFVKVLAWSLVAGEGKKLVASATPQPQSDLEMLRDLIERELIKPVIDRQYPLSAISNAMTYLESGRASGKVIIQI